MPEVGPLATRLLRKRDLAGLCAALTSAVTLVALADAATPGPAPRLHRAARTYDLLGERVAALAVADLNHDRRSDVVVGLEGGPADTAVLLAKRGGRLLPAPPLHTAGDASTIRGGLAVADLNGDGDRDIARVFVDQASPRPTSVVVMRGDGHGSFRARTVIRARCCGSDLAAGDFNGDRRRDLAVRGVGVFLGNGHGAFPVARAGLIGDHPGSRSESMLPADFNRDGRLDLVLLSRDELNYPEAPAIRFGQGDGRLGHAHVLRSAGNVVSAAIGKLNRDRRPDLAVLSDDGVGSQELRILLGTRSALPRLAHSRLRGMESNEVELADMNRDGATDVVVAGDIQSGLDDLGEFRILRGNGRGFVLGPLPIAARCCDGTHLEVGDFNRDGRPDLATTASRVEAGKTVQRLALLVNDGT